MGTPGQDIRNLDLSVDQDGNPALTWMQLAGNTYVTEYVPLGIPEDQFAGRCACDEGTQFQNHRSQVNTYSGSFSYQAADLVVPTMASALSMERTYTSLFAADPTIGDSPFGRGWRHSFDQRLLISPPSDPALTIFEAPSGNRLRFRATTGQPLLGVRGSTWGNSYTTLSGRNYIFNAQGQVTTSSHDQTGSSVYRYADGILRTVEDQGTKRTLTFTSTATPINGMRRILAVGDSSGREVQYSYTADGLLETATDLRGGVTRYAYDSAGLLTTVTDPLGVQQVSNIYLNGRVVAQVDAQGTETTFTTTDSGPYRATTVLRQGAAGTPQSSVDGYRLDGTPRYQSHNGQFAGFTAFKGRAIPAFQVDANGVIQRTQANQDGFPTTLVDANGATTAVQYTAQPLSGGQSIAAALPTQITSRGITTTMIYGPLQTLTETSVLATDGLRLTTRYTYTGNLDTVNRLAEQRTPAGVLTRMSYDRARNSSGVLIRDMTRTNVGALTPLAQTTVYTRNHMGRVTDVTVGYGTALAQTTHTDYRPDGLVWRTIQHYRGTGVYAPQFPTRNIPTLYGYDLLGRRIWEQRVDGRYYGVTSYNTRGQIRWTVNNPVSPAGEPLVPDTSATAPLPLYTPAYPDANVGVAVGYDDLGRTSLVTQTGILTGTFVPASQTFTDATIRVTRTDYDDQSRPVTVTQNYRPAIALGVSPDVNVQTISRYDAQGNVVLQRDPLGRWTKTAYDALNRPVTTTLNYALNPQPETIPGAEPQDFNLVQVTRYAPEGRVERMIENFVDGAFDPTAALTDRITLFQYDGLGRTVVVTRNASLVQPAGRTDLNQVTRTVYDPITGRLVATRAVTGNWTHTIYDALGRSTATIQNCRTAAGVAVPSGCAPFDPAHPDWNVRTSSTYNPLNQVVDRTDPLDQVNRTIYDPLGRVQAAIVNYQAGVPASASVNVTTQSAYNVLGQVITQTNALNQPTVLRYDALGRTTTVTDPDLRTTVVGYDGVGQQRWSRTADGRYTVTFIDGLGRAVRTVVNYQNGVVETSDGVDRDLVQTTRYDSAGRTIASRDPLDRETRFMYTLRDQIRAAQENVQTTCAPDATDCNLTTWYSYDRAGNQQWFIDARANRQRTTSYDSANRPTSATDALSQVTRWDYDVAGRVVTKRDPRGAAYAVQYGYDDLGRRTSTTATALSGPIVEQYNGRGQRISLEDASGVTSFARDPLGRIEAVTAASGVVGYSYDAGGQRTQLRYPSGTVVDYTYTPGGQMDTVRQGATVLADYTYDPAGRLGSLSRANGATTVYGYDTADRLRSLETTVYGTPRRLTV